MPLDTKWLTHLRSRRGSKVVTQAFRMMRFHRTPFRTLLRNVFEATEAYGAKFTFPMVASIALKDSRLSHEIAESGHEIAVHGFKHIKYALYAEPQQDDDMKRALVAFKTMGVSVKGFRAPYNSYSERTPRLVEKHHFLWDAGIGHDPKYRENTIPFRVPLEDSHMSSFTCLPLNQWSDDKMIDDLGFRGQQIEETLKLAIRKTAEKHGLIMFDLHPIRIGQPQYVKALKRVVAYGTELNGWFPTVTEAVNYWNKNESWKRDASFCCLLTGDIDNFVFSDYLRRLL